MNAPCPHCGARRYGFWPSMLTLGIGTLAALGLVIALEYARDYFIPYVPLLPISGAHHG